jgi:hypothetical protein
MQNGCRVLKDSKSSVNLFGDRINGVVRPFWRRLAGFLGAWPAAASLAAFFAVSAPSCGFLAFWRLGFTGGLGLCLARRGWQRLEPVFLLFLGLAGFC